MQLFVRSQETHVLDVTGGETVGQVKALVCQRENLEPEQLAVYLGGHPLEDEQVLTACTEDLSTLNVEVRLLGGLYII